MQKTAKLEGEIKDLYNGTVYYYSLSEPYLGYSHLTIQSMVSGGIGETTTIFGSDSTGNPLDWTELFGSYIGGLDQTLALRVAGYRLSN
jgi:hypothetical protein